MTRLLGANHLASTYGVWPPGMVHAVWIEGDTVVQFHGMGPWIINYVIASPYCFAICFSVTNGRSVYPDNWIYVHSCGIVRGLQAAKLSLQTGNPYLRRLQTCRVCNEGPDEGLHI